MDFLKKHFPDFRLEGIDFPDFFWTQYIYFVSDLSRKATLSLDLSGDASKQIATISIQANT